MHTQQRAHWASRAKQHHLDCDKRVGLTTNVTRLRWPRRHRSRRRCGQDGFSLIELLVAMAITVIGLTGLMSLHVTTMRGNQSSAQMVAATVIAQQTMEEIRSMPVESADPQARTLVRLLGSQITTAPVVVNLDPVLGAGNVSFARTVRAEELTTVSQELVRIRVLIEWAERGADINSPTLDPRLKHDFAIEMIRTRQDEI